MRPTRCRSRRAAGWRCRAASAVVDVRADDRIAPGDADAFEVVNRTTPSVVGFMVRPLE
jgi:hypothetical protein